MKERFVLQGGLLFGKTSKTIAAALGLFTVVVQLLIVVRVDRAVRRGRQDTDFKTFHRAVGEAQKGENIYTMHSRHMEWLVFHISIRLL